MVQAQSPEPCVIVLTLLPLLGCHVFEKAEVDCTSDLPCARGVNGRDSGEGDTADTAAVVGPSIVGWVISMTDGTGGDVRVFDPVDGEEVAEWNNLRDTSGLTVTGTPYYYPATGDGLLVSKSAYYLLPADGRAEYAGEGTGTSQYEVSHLGDQIIMALNGGIVAFDLYSEDEDWLVREGRFTEISYLGSNTDVAYFVVRSTSVDLWQLSEDGDAALVAENYTNSTSRTNVFVGPDNRPFACDSTGRIYALPDDADPVVRVGVASDIEDCAYDPGSNSYLAYSRTAGVFRTGADGETTQVMKISDGYTYDRVYWYGN